FFVAFFLAFAIFTSPKPGGSDFSQVFFRLTVSNRAPRRKSPVIRMFVREHVLPALPAEVPGAVTTAHQPAPLPFRTQTVDVRGPDVDDLLQFVFFGFLLVLRENLAFQNLHNGAGATHRVFGHFDDARQGRPCFIQGPVLSLHYSGSSLRPSL